MPDAVTFRVTTYYKLAKGETGITQWDSQRLSVSQALDVIINEFPDEAVEVKAQPGQVTITIDWSKTPAALTNPKIPVRRR